MKTDNWLHAAEADLASASITTARLDCLVLLEDVTAKNRAWLLAHPEFELPAELVNTLDTQIRRRMEHVPLAYIRGKVDFYGRTFAVNEHTLVPRPETETMLELLKTVTIQDKHDTQLIDVGTGSGAIAITAKLEFPKVSVTAIDIDENCLKVARHNAGTLHADVRFLQGNLLDPVLEHPDPAVLLCNLPYVPDGFQINAAATHEPRHALFAGPDGLGLYRELFRQIASSTVKPYCVLTEALPSQHNTLMKIARSTGYALRTTEDFIQLFQEV